ncbi:MAG: hypothetical protein PHE59_01855 [Patescibacteria group bacterium]|nr:hypothetical protein [Patescibacteria group bacterium]MDD5164090.1 hypothetical protein [Patescibacteria group bacterium]MDD5534252.1 hypothetical protein [Patescibacteria group bacterium]
MGGGGTYYDRDVTPKTSRTSRGSSTVAEEKMRNSNVDKTLLTVNREIVCPNKSPIVYAFDVTGSMGNLPKIIYDKMPMIAGQIVEQNYLQDPVISLAAVGDRECDDAPIQVCDFSLIRNLDSWLQKIWLEGGGGGQSKESYEFTAYFYARRFKMPNAVTPIFLFTGDEGFRENLTSADLGKHFGGKHESVSSKLIFEELKKKFMGNVFLIHRYYEGGNDKGIVNQWEGVLGEEKVIKLESDLAIADLTLGIFALVTGKCTLEKYLQEMENRGQDKKRIAEIEKSLKKFAATVKSNVRSTSKIIKVEPSSAKPQSVKAKPQKVGRL